MQESMLIGLAVVAILVVGVVLFMKREHYETCPTGFQLSLNGQACVFPGEKFPTCNNDQEFVDNACRTRLPSGFEPPSGWTTNQTGTGIQSLYETCPTGLQLSLNGQACVLPGEKFLPCNNGQEFVYNACRWGLPCGFQPPSGWRINHSGTGIQQL